MCIEDVFKEVGVIRVDLVDLRSNTLVQYTRRVKSGLFLVKITKPGFRALPAKSRGVQITGNLNIPK